MAIETRVHRRAYAMACAAILLWGTLAWLGVALAAMPPFLLVACALIGAGVLALPTWRSWRVDLRVLALGVYGLFGFHFFLFVALRFAPALEANLINYLWPLLIVLLAPLFLRDARLSRAHVAGALLGFGGAALVILSAAQGSSLAGGGRALWGCACALVSALIWASYSLGCRRLRERGVQFSSAAIGLLCLVSGLLALLCHVFFEAPYRFLGSELLPLAALSIGPMGGAFFLWDAALAQGDARVIGSLAYATPLLSTCLLAATGHGSLGWVTVVALLLIVGGAWIGARASRPAAA